MPKYEHIKNAKYIEPRLHECSVNSRDVTRFTIFIERRENRFRSVEHRWISRPRGSAASKRVPVEIFVADSVRDKSAIAVSWCRSRAIDDPSMIHRVAIATKRRVTWLTQFYRGSWCID